LTLLQLSQTKKESLGNLANTLARNNQATSSKPRKSSNFKQLQATSSNFQAASSSTPLLFESGAGTGTCPDDDRLLLPNEIENPATRQ
jgi:hypothetical protein